MTVYDSSALIDYLDGRESVVSYVAERVDDRALAPALVFFEVYQGEVFKAGPAEFDAVDAALGWVGIVEETAGIGRAGAELQAALRERGTSLAARDAYVAGTASHLGDKLVVSDSDFDVPELRAFVEVELL